MKLLLVLILYYVFCLLVINIIIIIVPYTVDIDTYNRTIYFFPILKKSSYLFILSLQSTVFSRLFLIVAAVSQTVSLWGICYSIIDRGWSLGYASSVDNITKVVVLVVTIIRSAFLPHAVSQLPLRLYVTFGRVARTC